MISDSIGLLIRFQQSAIDNEFRNSSASAMMTQYGRVPDIAQNRLSIYGRALNKISTQIQVKKVI
jgi:hypothetical protein